MTNINVPLDELSPKEKRELLSKLLKEKARNQVTSYPASDGQRALFYVQALSPESFAYNIAFSVRIHSEVDISLLHRAAQFITDRHATLRTAYEIRDNDLIQNVSEWQEPAFELINAAGWSEEELYQQVTAAFQMAFDLIKGPISRWQLFTRGEKDHVFIFCVHHIAVDAWSLTIILNDLKSTLQALKNGAQPKLPQVTRQYSHWANWQAEMLAGSEGERLKSYWKNQLAGDLPAIDLTPDFPRPTEQVFRGDSLSFTMTAEISKRLKTLAQAEGVTLYMLLLAAFQTLLHRYTGQDDILVGTPTFGRSQSEYIGVVGYFVNPVVLRGQLGGNPSFHELLVRTRQCVVGALENQDYPFLRLVENVDTRPDPGRSPIFQCMFNILKYQPGDLTASLAINVGETYVDFGGMLFSPYLLHQQEGQFELTLDVVDNSEELVFILNYLTDLFRRDTISHLLDSFKTLLYGLLESPNTPIAELPILSTENRKKILVEWNQTHAKYPRDRCVHHFIQDQAELTPDAVAVVFEGELLNYQQLNKRANQLAHKLRNLGIGSDQMVGVYLERSLDMVVAVLGVMKSGGAYVPMDPMFPPQRISYMIEDSQMPVIITQQSLADSLPPHYSQLLLMDRDAPQLSFFLIKTLNHLVIPNHWLM